MAKALVGASVGGKVAVSGLSADVVKQGTTVTVRQGAKTIAEVTGTLESADDLDVLATMYYYTGDIATVTYWNGAGYVTGSVQTGFGSVTVKGTIKRVMIFQSSGGNICGHSGPGTYTSGHTNTISGFDNKAQSFVVLGRK